MDGIVDTTVVIHLFRKYAPAVAWFDKTLYYAVTPITWLEVIEGSRNKVQQQDAKTVLEQFAVAYLSFVDQDWAMEQHERLHFSHHIAITDCLIASVAFRLQVPLYTHNLKDMTPLLGALAVQPYR